jgi:hypothetical protein
MREQHLSDQAVAACADDVLPGLARTRALRHVATCAECAYAVAVQREAVWALRAAPAPALPGGLLARLREVPVTTPLTAVPGTVSADGTAMFATFGAMHSMGGAALVAPARPVGEPAHRSRHVLPMVATAAAVVAAGVVAVGSATPASSVTHGQPQRARSQTVVDQQPRTGGADLLVSSVRWMR